MFFSCKSRNKMDSLYICTSWTIFVTELHIFNLSSKFRVHFKKLIDLLILLTFCSKLSFRQTKYIGLKIYNIFLCQHRNISIHFITYQPDLERWPKKIILSSNLCLIILKCMKSQKFLPQER